MSGAQVTRARKIAVSEGVENAFPAMSFFCVSVKEYPDFTRFCTS